MRRLTLTAIALALLLAACGGQPAASPEPSAPPTMSAAAPTPTPSPSPTRDLVAWAGGVCAARDAVGQSLVDVARTLSIDPSGDASVGQQLLDQMEAQWGQVEQATGDLGTAIGAMPIDYGQALTSIGALQAAGEAFTEARDQVRTDLTAAGSADGPLAFGRAMLAVVASGKAAFDAGTDYLATLDRVTQDPRSEVREAFATAPQCR